MRLHASRSNESFYESFSDLLFGTVVLFVVLIAGIAVKLQEATATYQAETKKLISPNRFAGGSKITEFYWSPFNSGGVEYVVWVPLHIETRLQLADQREAVAELAVAAADGQSLLIIPTADMEKLARGFRNVRDDYTVIQAHTPGIWVEWARRAVARGEAATAVVGRLDSADLNLGSAWTRERFEAVYYRFEGAAPNIANQRASLHLHVPSRGKGPIRVGDLELAPWQVRCLLESIKPGRGWFVEIVDAESGAAKEPPDWVFEEILIPTGFDNRVVAPLIEKGGR